MMDPRPADVKELERLKRREEQIEDMLVSVDYRLLIEELNYECKYSSPARLDLVRILYKIKKTGLYDKKKLQKLINHYAIEHDNMLVLKP